MSVVARLSDFIERQVPDRYRAGDPDELRGARQILWFCFLLGPVTPLFAIPFLLHGHYGPAALLLSASLLMILIGPLLRRSLLLALHVQLASGLITTLASVSFTGGVGGFGAAWTACIPLLALLAGGRRIAIGWLGVASAGLLGFTVWELLGGRPLQPLTGTSGLLQGASSALLFPVAMLALALVYEANKERMRHELSQAARAMRLVLEHIAQGLIVIELDGRVAAERSPAADRWLRSPPVGTPIWAQLARLSPRVAEQLEVGWAALRENPDLAELLLEQLPRRVKLDGSVLSLSFQPILAQGRLARVLLVISDVTMEVERQRADQEKGDLATLAAKLLGHRVTVLEFIRCGEAQMEHITDAATPRATLLRELHTLKGNAAALSLSGLASLCHEIEDRLAERQGGLTDEEREELRLRWTHLTEPSEQIVGLLTQQIGVSIADHAALIERIRGGTPRGELVQLVDAWRQEPLSDRLEHCAEQIRCLGERLGRAPIEVHVSAGGLRLPAGRFSAFFAAFTHVVRNAVDHGIEPPEERLRAGKRGAGTVILRAEQHDGGWSLVIQDDGRGIDWRGVAERARARGLPTDRHDDLIEALFTDGFSTAQAVTEVSGRGVGLGAARAACAALGGFVSIASEEGFGTRLTFHFPAERRRAAERAGRRSSRSPPPAR